MALSLMSSLHSPRCRPPPDGGPHEAPDTIFGLFAFASGTSEPPTGVPCRWRPPAHAPHVLLQTEFTTVFPCGLTMVVPQGFDLMSAEQLHCLAKVHRGLLLRLSIQSHNPHVFLQTSLTTVLPLGFGMTVPQGLDWMTTEQSHCLPIEHIIWLLINRHPKEAFLKGKSGEI